MKNILCFLLLLGANVSAQQVQFEDPRQNFGFVHEGDTVVLHYRFINSGHIPLLISSYEVECGCTTAELPAAAIPPGEKGIITVRFDTHEKYDRQDRTVAIISNSSASPDTISFKGVVLKPRRKK